MDTKEGVELLFLLLSFVSYTSYTVYVIFISDRLGLQQALGLRHVQVLGVRRRAQALWSEVYGTEAGSIINALQTLRNVIMAVTFLASVTALLAVQVFGALLDPPLLQRVLELSEKDVITGGSSLLTATAKLGILITCLLIAFFFFLQAIRLYSHLSFLSGVVSTPVNRQVHAMPLGHYVALASSASVALSLGIRTFLYFAPLILWVFGPTMLLASTLALLVGMVYFDTIVPVQAPDMMSEPAKQQQGDSAATVENS